MPETNAPCPLTQDGRQCQGRVVAAGTVYACTDCARRFSAADVAWITRGPVLVPAGAAT